MSKFFEEPILSDNQKDDLCSCDQGSVSPEARYNDYRNRMPFHYIEDDINDGYYYWTFGATMEIEFELEGNIAFGEDTDLEPGQIIVDSELSLTSKNPVENRVITEALNNKLDKSSEASDFDQAYIKTTDGKNGLKNISENTLSNSIVSRGPSGRFKILDAVEDDQPITLRQAKIAHAIQADWNQEDTTSEAYIKNKPEIYKGTGTSSLKQKEDPKYNGVIKAVDKNPYAKVLETTLTNEEVIGANGDYAVSLGGNSSAQGKRSLGAGTSSVAKGAYSHSLGDNTVTTIKGTDSTAIGYQTTTDAPASFADGSYTVVLGQKYIEGMFDPLAEPGQPGTPTEPGTTPTDSLEMDKRRGEAGHASGFNSYVSGFAGYADGVSNVADGHISKSSGRSNRSWSYLSKTDGYQSVVKPDDTDPNATGEGSWANGKDIQIVGAKYAYSGGEGNVVIAGADNSFSYGKGLQSKGQSQTVIGQYNENHSEDVFEVGSGQDIVNRKTTFRVTKDGKAYYNEFEVSNLKTTGDKIAELDNKLTPKINSNTTEISNLWTTVRDTNTNLNRLNETKLDKTGGTVTGTLNVKENLNVTGNLNVSGTATAVRTQSLLVIDNVIATNADKKELTTLLSGLALNKNANETYGLMYDPADNTVKFGQGTLSDTGVFTFTAGEGNPIAIRDDSSKFNDNHFVKWDEDTNKFVDSGFLAEDFVDVATQQTISGIKTFTDETHFGTTHFSKDLNVDNASIKVFDTTKDLVTQYKADSITIDNGTNPAAVQYVLNIPKESGTLLVNKFQYSKFDTSNDGDSWTLTDSNKNLELKYQDDNSHSSVSLEKDYIELFDVNGTGTAKVNLSSNIITLDSESTEGQHKLFRITPDKVTIGNSTDAALIEIDSNSTKFNNRPQVKDNGNYVNIALSNDLNNYVTTQSESADNYYAQLTNENGIISARIFQNGNETDTQNLIVDKDGVRILNNKVATENQLTNKVDKLAESLRSQAYVKDSNGDNTGLSYTYTDEGGTLAVRNASGQLQVSAPLNAKDAANKEFVENSKYVVGNGLNLTEATNTLNANIVKIQDSISTEFTPDENGVVTIPKGSRTNFGLLKSNFVDGIQSPNGILAIWPASKEDLDKRTNSFSGTLYPDGPMRPIVYNAINYAVKAALTDNKRIGTETTASTAFTDTEKDRACEVLGAVRYAMKVTIL